MTVTSLYEREKEFLKEETERLIKLIKLKGQQRRAQRVQKEMNNRFTSDSEIERKIMVNLPQLREGSAASSEQQKEEISEWVNRVLKQRADWPWDWTERAEEPAWNDDYQWSQ